MTMIHAYKCRGLTKDLTIQDANGDTITPGADDTLRVMIGREGDLGVDGANAELRVVSTAATANGSSLIKGGGGTAVIHRLRLDASDLAFSAGTYTFFFDYYDAEDANEWKNIDRQVFVLEDT